MSEVILERMRLASRVKEDAAIYKTRSFLGRCTAGKRSRGDVGLELEIEGSDLPSFIDYLTPDTAVRWTTHEDGSLRGDENYEYVTGGAIKVSEVDGALTALWAEFEKNKSTLMLSNRCSTHVHVNMSMFTPKPITSLIALYTIVEEAVTNWCGDGRVSNPFCLRVKDSKATLELWQDLLNGKSINDYGGDRDRNYRFKYGGMNILPLFTQGSVEFRPLRGVDNKDTIIAWVNFLWALREEARTTFANPMDIASAVSAHGVKGLIEDIVAKHHLEGFWQEVVEHPDNGDNLGRMLREGFTMIQPLLFQNKWDLTPTKIEDGEVPETAMEKQKREERILQMEKLRAKPPVPEPEAAGLNGFDELLRQERNQQAVEAGIAVNPWRDPFDMDAAARLIERFGVGEPIAPAPRAARRPKPPIAAPVVAIEDDFEGEI